MIVLILVLLLTTGKSDTIVLNKVINEDLKILSLRKGRIDIVSEVNTQKTHFELSKEVNSRIRLTDYDVSDKRITNLAEYLLKREYWILNNSKYEKIEEFVFEYDETVTFYICHIKLKTDLTEIVYVSCRKPKMGLIEYSIDGVRTKVEYNSSSFRKFDIEEALYIFQKSQHFNE